MQYAFVLTRRGEYELADEVLRHILMSNGYRSKEKQVTIRLAIITCAIAVDNYTVVVEQCRKLINAYQFNNEPMRLLLSSLASGLRPTDSFISSTLQKHMLREVRLSDGAVKTPELLKWNNSSQRYHLGTVKSVGDDEVIKGTDALEDDAEDAGDAVGPTPTNDRKPLWLPTKNNPFPVTLYGQLCLAAKSYQSAIFYLLHGYDYCQEDPIICLCLALSSLGRAMQRQADNRNHLIAQGMACLSQYRTARRQAGEHVLPEIEFNFGRAFQQLGLHTLAVTHYEKALQLAEEQKDDVSVAREAAYNLSLIYITTGALPLAEALYRRWLSV
jgi:general transcription factor 3C polypeptide 3 (transcription factor C subunit 4)